MSPAVDIRRMLAWALAAGLAAAATDCGQKPDGSPPGQAAASGPPTVEVTLVVERPIDVTLDVPGELTPFQTVAIFPKVTGFITTIRVDRGSRVRAGDLLVELQAPELVAQRAEAQSKLQGAQAQLAVARAKADASSSTFEKLKSASATPGVVAGNDLVIAQKALEVDRSQIAAAEQGVEAARQSVDAIAQLDAYLNVTAPFDGVITERNVHPGALVGPASGPDASTPLLRLVDNSRLRLVVPVPEDYVAGVSAGMPVTFSVAAFPGRSFDGKVSRIADLIDPKTRTMPVEIDVANADHLLAPGSFCQVRWPVHRSGPSLFVPARSVASTTGRTFVVRVQNGRIDWVDVRTGLTSGGLIEVFGNLHAGDAVATRGSDELRSGAEVKTISAKPGS